ncbi:MAG: hypothetical protein EXX96DRAFT_121781 [Benjaminiella poitrasii]|nr:MAG: hypothetical protein EXX96DRAFT_121781 [Benjaminiella poitrasii]
MSFLLSSRLISVPIRKERITEWIGIDKKRQGINSESSRQTPIDWKDIQGNIQQMDQLYDATFYSWLKSEENVLVTSIYLQRIVDEYPLDRTMHALTWLTADWRWESTSILVRHVTLNWSQEEGDDKRAKLLRYLTKDWAIHFTAALMTTVLVSAPYSFCSETRRERFLRIFTDGWDFSKLSEFFMFLKSRAHIDNKFKCMMLQEAARKNDNSDGHSAVNKMMKTSHCHPRRTSSNDFQELKRTILEDIDHPIDKDDSGTRNNN